MHISSWINTKTFWNVNKLVKWFAANHKLYDWLQIIYTSKIFHIYSAVLLFSTDHNVYVRTCLFTFQNVLKHFQNIAQCKMTEELYNWQKSHAINRSVRQLSTIVNFKSIVTKIFMTKIIFTIWLIKCLSVFNKVSLCLKLKCLSVLSKKCLSVYYKNLLSPIMYLHIISNYMYLITCNYM